MDDLTQAEVDQILHATDIVTLARTAVERDYVGEIINSQAKPDPCCRAFADASAGPTARVAWPH